MIKYRVIEHKKDSNTFYVAQKRLFGFLWFYNFNAKYNDFGYMSQGRYKYLRDAEQTIYYDKLKKKSVIVYEE